MASIGFIFTNNLHRLRKERGWTQEELAERAEISARGVQQLESGESWPEKATVKALAAALGVPEERLFLPPEYRVEPTIPECLRTLAAAHGFEATPLKKRRGPRQLRDA